MDKLLKIIQINEGKYVLDTDVLYSALKQAENCDNIALISIVGPKGHGKTFFINCLINYIKSEHKDEWPHSADAIIKRDYIPKLDYNIITPIIQLTSKPFIITDEIKDKIIKTAVFLMDSTFDNDITSKQVQDIIELFLLTSSTVIYNHMRYLPKQEFSKLETIISRISHMDNSLDSMKKILFLIRDWYPEKRKNEFSFGLYEGSKYIKNFIENIQTEKSYHDLNCFLMSAPELNTQTKIINLSELNEQFLLDLKNLIDFKLLNIEEMLKKRKHNSNDYMNSTELFNLFNNCVEKLNRDLDNNLLVESLTVGFENLTIEEQSKDETHLYEKNKLEMNGFNSVLTNKNSKESESSDDSRDDKSFTISEGNAEEFMTENDSDDSLPSEKKNIDHTHINGSTGDSSNTIITENMSRIPKIDSKKCSENNNSKAELRYNFMDNFDEGIKEREFQFLPTFPKVLRSEYQVPDSNHHHKLKQKLKTKRSRPHASRSSSSIRNLSHQDIRGINYHDYKSYDNKNDESNGIKESFVNNNKVDEVEIESRYKDLVDELLLEYNTDMETKLKDQTFDFDKYLRETHGNLKMEIFKTFENKSDDIEPSLINRNSRDKYYKVLYDEMAKSMKTYIQNVEVKLFKARNQCQNVVKKILVQYKLDMESSIMNQIKDDPHMISLSNIQRVSKDKAFKTFKEETDKFFNENIETEFLNKLIEEINQINYCFETLWDHYRTFESESQKIFSNFKYYSVEKIEQFYENQISRLIDSLQKIRQSDLIKFTVSLFDKSFNVLKEKNNFIEDKEQSFADKAIDLAYKKYENCLEAKMRTGFFAKDQLNNICDKLLKYTIKEFIDSCDFNQYQNNLIDYCKNKITFKVEEINKRKLNGYQEKINSTKNMLNKAIEESFGVYCYSMNEKSSTVQSKTHLNSREFTELHHKYSEMAIEKFNKLAEFLNIDYDPEYVRNIILEHESLLKNLIKNEKQKLKTLNDKNTPDIHSVAVYLGKQYIIAATHQNGIYEIISDKFKQKLRPNSISFGNEILIGTEAKNHYENTFPDEVSFKNYDIKQLLARERSLVSEEELKSYPFTFHRDKLSVIVDYEGHNIDLYIESLLAFMILDIKLCAEKQIQNIMSNIVLTVPTNYTINQKNAIRNAAKIAGFEHCDVIREVSAAAIGYVFERADFLNKIMDNVLIIIINDYECDVAICCITNKKIKYKKYYHQTLNIAEKRKLYQIIKGNRKSEENHDKIAEHNFNELIDRILNISKFKIKTFNINQCVIAGNSHLIPKINTWIKKYINPIPSDMSNSMDIIIKGSAIYAEMLANKINFIQISEVTTHNIYLNFEQKYPKEKRIELLHRNTRLPVKKSKEINSLKSSDLPLNIFVNQDDQIVKTHSIDALPLYEHSNHEHTINKHIMNFDIDFFGQIYIVSVLTNKKQTSGKKLESIDINPGLNENDLEQEKQKLSSLLEKIQEKIKKNEEKRSLVEAISDFSRRCASLKKQVGNDVEMRPLIRKQIVLEIEKTENFLKREHLNLNDIEKHKQILKKTLEALSGKSLLQG